ncbi:MAG: HPr kinase/phosphatase C-terminal domain-containing protein [Alphaproteobacteria bacterium]|jgi:HPr kinase/phosphorylase|nr:HPr kinase/phosphatase C-terminal domain-containing protein [Alphaproteobacteria bacterium]
MLIHATCVARAGKGLLLLGASGAGKSLLALRLIEAGWSLVADDQVLLRCEHEALWAEAPAPLAGMIEARGLGIFRGIPHAPARLTAAARLTSSPPRLPEPARFAALGLTLPEFPLDAAHPAAPTLCAWALRAALGELTQTSGAFAP